MAQWLQLAQPTSQHWRDAIERQFGMNLQQAFRLACSKPLGGVATQTLLKLRQRRGRQCKPHRKCVPAEAREEVRACLNRFQQRKPMHRPARTMRHAFLYADDDRRLGRALHYTRSQDADDAAMPSVAIEHKHRFGGQSLFGSQALFNRLEHEGFRIATLEVEPFEFCGQLLRASESAS